MANLNPLEQGPARPIPFIDLQAQRARIGDALDAAIARVLDHGKFIMGPEVAELEQALAEFCGAAHCISCANGTDALMLALMAEGIGPGDAVLVPSFTFIATGEAVAEQRATPFFVDVLPDTFNMDPASLERSIEAAASAGLTPKMVIPVDLFGQPADYGAIAEIAARHGLTIVADAAQSFGARSDNRAVGTLGDYTTTSFFPAKPLGCYGDGGAIFTEDAGRDELLRSLRIHGQGSNKYDNVRIGLNSRLDTLQAAILLEKLSILPDEIERRQSIAAGYAARLGDRVVTPVVPEGMLSVWAQYTVLLDDEDARARVQAACREAEVPTAIYYPVPLHRQPGYLDFPQDPEGLPVSEDLAQRVLSLPMHPYLDAATQDFVADTVRAALE